LNGRELPSYTVPINYVMKPPGQHNAVEYVQRVGTRRLSYTWKKLQPCILLEKLTHWLCIKPKTMETPQPTSTVRLANTRPILYRL